MTADFTNPAYPFELGFYDVPEYAVQVAVVGGYAYVVGESRLRIVDVSDSAAPKEIVYCDALKSANDVAVAGEYAFIADGAGGLVILRLVNRR